VVLAHKEHSPALIFGLAPITPLHNKAQPGYAGTTVLENVVRDYVLTRWARLSHRAGNYLAIHSPTNTSPALLSFVYIVACGE
jgi:hypothetical protein